MDWLAVYAAVVGTIALGWQIYSYWRDTYRVIVKARQVPGLWILEVTNTGRQPITITGAGVANRSKGSDAPTPGSQWHVREDLPKRIEDRDALYLSLSLGQQPEATSAEYVWVRDANGKTHHSPLPNLDAALAEASPDTEQSATDLPRLYALAEHWQDMKKTKRQLAMIEAVEEVARLRAEYEARKAQTRADEKKRFRFWPFR